MATTSTTWISALVTWKANSPSAHRMSSTTAMARSMGWPFRNRLRGRPATRGRALRFRRASGAVVHVELDRARGGFPPHDLGPLQLGVGVDLLLREDVALEQE